MAPRFRVSALTRVRLESGGDARYLRSVREGDGVYRGKERQGDKTTRRGDEARRKGQRQRAGREGAAPRIEGDSGTSSDIEEGVQRALRELNF